MRSSIGRSLAIAMIGVSLLLCIVFGRAFIEGQASLKQGDHFNEEDRPRAALRSWRQAARWYVPGAQHVGEALNRMQALAESSRAMGAFDLELDALRGIRSSVWAIRSVIHPNQDRLEPVNRRIAELMAAMEDPTLDPSRNEVQRADWHYALLAKDTAPHRGFTLVAAFGFLLWIGAALIFALKGFDERDHLRSRVALYAAIMFALGQSLWLWGLSAA